MKDSPDSPLLKERGVISFYRQNGYKFILLCSDCTDSNLRASLEKEGFKIIPHRCQTCRNDFDGSEVSDIKDVLLAHKLIND